MRTAIYEQMICDSKFTPSSLQSKERRKPDSSSPVKASAEGPAVEVEQSISLFDLSQSPGIRSVESATRSVQSGTRSVESGTQLFGDEGPLQLCGQKGLLHFVSPGPRCSTPATPADYQPSLLISTNLNHADSQPSNSPCLASADGKSSNRIKSKEASRAREGVRGPHGNWHATRADFVRADLAPEKKAVYAGEPTPADKCGGSEPVGPRVSEVPGGPIRSVSASPESAEAVKRSLSLESPHTSLSSEHLTHTDSPHTAPPPESVTPPHTNIPQHHSYHAIYKCTAIMGGGGSSAHNSAVIQTSTTISHLRGVGEEIEAMLHHDLSGHEILV